MSIDPNSNKFTYDDYALIPNDGKRHEIIDGDHLMNPAPNSYHQLISGRLYYQLYSQIAIGRQGWVFDAPVDVQLTEFDVVQPDLVVILKDRKKVLIRNVVGFAGIPFFAI